MYVLITETIELPYLVSRATTTFPFALGSILRADAILFNISKSLSVVSAFANWVAYDSQATSNISPKGSTNLTPLSY